MDEQATFHWPGGGTPLCTLCDGTCVHCECHGRVPYLRSGTFGWVTPGSSSSAKALPTCASPAKVPTLGVEAAPRAPEPMLLRSDPSSESYAPPACAGDDEDELNSELPSLPRQSAAVRAQMADIEESGPDYVPPPGILDGGIDEEVDPPPLNLLSMFRPMNS